MGDTDGEPPDDRYRQRNISNLVKTVQHQDSNGIILRPDLSRGILGVCNATVLGENMGYRERIKANNEYGQTSVGTRQRIENGDPRKPIGEPKRILIPSEEYDIDGCEDLRFSEGFITYVGFKEGPKGGARIALAEASKDFTKIKKYGVIGPQIRLREAMDLFQDERYIAYHGKQESKLKANDDPYLTDKDAALFPINEEYWLIHRIEPDIWLTKVKNIRELTNQDMWREALKNPKDHIILKAPEGIMKYGLGDCPREIDGRLIASGHQVTGSEGNFLNYYDYTSFLMQFSKDGKIISKMGSTIPFSDNVKYFDEYIGKGANRTLRHRKKVEFGEGFAIDPENSDTLIFTYGLADSMLGYRTISKTHVINDLDHPANRIAA